MASSEIIESTIERIQKDGWLQNALYDEETQAVCMRGGLFGIREKSFFHSDFLNQEEVFKAEVYVAKAIHGEFPLAYKYSQNDPTINSRNIVWYNDEEGRTKQEVLDTLMEAAKLARNEGD